MHSHKNPVLSTAMGWRELGEGQEQTLNVDNFLDAFVSVDHQGRIIAWNLQAEYTFGWPRREALGLSFSQIIVPARNRHLFEQTMRQFGNGNSHQKSRTRITALHLDGKEFEIELIAFSMHSDNRIGIFARQHGQRPFTETEIEKCHHANMNQLGECYAETDLRGNFVFINKTYSETFGTSLEARQGNSYKAIFPSEVGGLLRDAYTRVYRTGQPTKIDYSLTLQNGKQVFNEQSISLKRDAQGNPVGFMIIVRDCFQRKQNEIELMRAKQTAESASRAKGEFLANMSHEIRTPLNGVTGMLELIAYTNTTSEQQELLAMAQNAADSLLMVINDILDFSKIEAGKLEFDRTGFNLSETVAQAAGILMITATKKDLGLSYELDPDVPLFVSGDPVRLKQVLVNLIGNAVKFTEHGKIKVHVQVEKLHGLEVQLRFSVSDSGIGIPAEKQKAIFEAFSQADASTTRKFGGTGLGLTICARIVQSMGGDIWVESEIGRGSTFHFTVALEVTKGTASNIAQHSVIDRGLVRKRPLRVLLAEDNVINQRLALRLLEKLGYQVVLAASGTEALAKSDEEFFDLVLMDVQMPDIDGFSATTAIRAREAGAKTRVPIIAVTAHAMKGDRERCIEAGMDDYISKPISLDALKKVIERVTDPLLTKAGE